MPIWRCVILCPLAFAAGCLPDLIPPEDTGAGPFTIDVQNDCSHSLSEIGDEFSDYEDLGVFDPPATICGSIYGTGHADNGTGQEIYDTDVDVIRFEAPHDASYRFWLNWEADDGDYDLLLYTDPSTADAYSYNDKPEEFNFSVDEGTQYYMVIGGWEGAASPWMLRISRNE